MGENRLSMRYSARDLSLAGLFGALGVALPMLFHVVGLGKVFLPMHLPVLTCGLLVTPPVGFAVGFVTPLISSIATGMPPLIPMALLMTLELGAIGAGAGVARRILNLPSVAAVVFAMILGRVVGGLETISIAPLLGLKPDIGAYLAASIVTSWPGLLLQLAVAPAVAAAIDKLPSSMIRNGKEAL